MKFFFILTLFLVSLQVAGSAKAHGGDDHEHAAPAALTTQIAPRASVQTEDFELVLVLQGRSLIIYLDRFADNELVAGAQIEVESGVLLKVIAKPTAPGVYVIELANGAMEKAGKYPLSISVQTEQVSDVMTASLEIPEIAEEAHDHPTGVRTWLWFVLGAVMVLGTFFVFRVIRKRLTRLKA